MLHGRGIDLDRQICEVLLDIDGTDALRQLDQRFQLEQRVADQAMSDLAGLFGIEGGEAFAGIVVEYRAGDEAGGRGRSFFGLRGSRARAAGA